MKIGVDIEKWSVTLVLRLWIDIKAMKAALNTVNVSVYDISKNRLEPPNQNENSLSMHNLFIIQNNIVYDLIFDGKYLENHLEQY